MLIDPKVIAYCERVLNEALNLWHADIIDPSAGDFATPPDGDTVLQRRHAIAVRSRALIDDILLACDLDHHVPYKGNHRGPEWCGAFLAKCARVAGFDPKLLKTWFPSTYRLWALHNYRPFDEKNPNKKPAAGPYRISIKVDGKLPDGFVMPPGATVIVGDGQPSVGDHVTVGKRVTATGIETVSGNGGGTGPDGKHREGVVVREFPFVASSGYRVLWVHLPAPSDIVLG